MADLIAPIVRADDEQRIVLGPVLIPGEPDTDGDVVSAEQVERVAHLFARKYANLDIAHTMDNRADLVESYIAPVDLDFEQPGTGLAVRVPKGSWILGAYVSDEATWQAVKEGRLTGFSIMAVNPAEVQLGIKSGKPVGEDAMNRITLSDLNAWAGGEQWIVTYVSMVDDPAIPKAKFVAIKRAPAPAEPGLIGRVFDALKVALGPATDNKEEDDMKLEEMTAALKAALDERDTKIGEVLDEIGTELVTVKEALRTIVEPDDDDDDDEDGDDESVEDQASEKDAEEDENADEDEADDEDESVKARVSAIEKAVESLLTRGVPFSNRIRGQDGDDNGEKAVEGNVKRDTFGRAVA